MTFVSYAQNLEDVMLARVFGDVAQGFYIDVGANDPVGDSVTKVFYDRGWRGINLEPMEYYYRRLCEARVRDVNLPVAVGTQEGIFPYYEIPGSGLSTLDSRIAEGHRKNGLTVVRKEIPMTTLAAICRQHAQQTIHFLKVDVEGAEKLVLLGMDFQNYRPWVLIVEATLPNSQKENYRDWEDILLANGYQFVYFDGLSRFYVSQEKAAELKKYFTAPPNFFDHYLRYSEYCLRCEKEHLLEEIRKLTRQRDLLQAELLQLQRRS